MDPCSCGRTCLHGITRGLLRELADCVERADLNPAVHVLLLGGNGGGFCGGYDLVDSAEGMGRESSAAAGEAGTPVDPLVMAANEGRYDLDTQHVDGIGPVRVAGADGYRLETRDVTVDLKGRTMVSHGPASGAMRPPT